MLVPFAARASAAKPASLDRPRKATPAARMGSKRAAGVRLLRSAGCASAGILAGVSVVACVSRVQNIAHGYDGFVDSVYSHYVDCQHGKIRCQLRKPGQPKLRIGWPGKFCRQRSGRRSNDVSLKPLSAVVAVTPGNIIDGQVQGRCSRRSIKRLVSANEERIGEIRIKCADQGAGNFPGHKDLGGKQELSGREFTRWKST